MSEIRSNLAKVESRIARACARSDRARDEVRLIAVSKMMPAIAVAEALDAGVTDIGENRVQEAAGKFGGFRGGVRHLIGPLQSNKARKAIELFDWIQTVDSVRLAERLDRIAGEMDRRPNVLIQVNIGGEESKSGVAPRAAADLARQTSRFSNLELHGLMTIPPIAEEGELRGFFSRMRTLREECSSEAGEELRELSMGMSGDFEVAIEEGATMIRVGTAVFGGRP